MTILPLAYFGSLEWWREALAPDAVIDVGENYVKQSCRNRCEILSASGRMSLTANVVKGASIHKKAVRDMRLDYSKRWQHQHWNAMRSAYKNTPYYDYFADSFEPFFSRRVEFLYDFDRSIAETVARIIGRPDALRFSEEYVTASPADRDLRVWSFLGAKPAQEYWQVFSDRLTFEPNLSVVDFLFSEGRDVGAALQPYNEPL